MSIYKPSELRPFLNQLGIFPKKGLSQNFLIDGNIIRKIIAISEVNSEDIILEIGPGPGALTQGLLETNASVVAVEKDEILAKALERFHPTYSSEQFRIFCHDILTFPLREVITPLVKQGQKAKVIANLPYHLTTPILTLFAPLYDLFSSLTVMVQEEVGRRMTAQPNTSDYSSFTVFLRFFAEPEYAFMVSHHCFYPAPRVDSAVVLPKLRSPPLTGENMNLFFQLTRTAFEHRRKMLRSSLKDLFSAQTIEVALESIGLNPLSRPENLSLEEFLQLFSILYPS